MKKQILALSAFLLIGSALFMTGCSEDDTTAPVITILGDNPTVSLLNVTYVDAGATANDDKDGNLTSGIVKTGSVTNSAAGKYEISYSVSDAAGNAALEARNVYVVDLGGSYAVVDECPPSTPSNYSDVLSITGGTNVNWSKFANYQNGSVNGTISGSTVTVPSQTVACGAPGSVANRTFSGSGTLSFTLSGNNIVRKIVLPYTEVTNGTTTSCTGTYTK